MKSGLKEVSCYLMKIIKNTLRANGNGNVPQNDDMEGLSALDVEHNYLGYFLLSIRLI